MERMYDWLNVSGVLYLRDGRRIGPGMKFSAPLSEVPKDFTDTIKRLDVGVEEPTPSPTLSLPELAEPETVELADNVPLPETHFVVEERQGGGWYDVIVQATGEAVNGKALRYDVAWELAEEMNNGDITG